MATYFTCLVHTLCLFFPIAVFQGPSVSIYSRVTLHPILARKQYFDEVWYKDLERMKTRWTTGYDEVVWMRAILLLGSNLCTRQSK